MATSVPVPMAMPTSAWASAGASLMPSPTMATRRPSGLQRRDLGGLLLRQHLGEHRVDADLAAIASAVASVVAGEHDHVEAELPEAAHRRRGARLDRVGDGDRPDRLVVHQDRDDVLPWPASPAARVAGVAGEPLVAGHDARGRPPRRGCRGRRSASNPGRRRDFDAALAGGRQDRDRERVLAAALGAGHEAQELGVVEAAADREVAPVPGAEQHHVGHARLALGDACPSCPAPPRPACAPSRAPRRRG